MKCPKCGYLGFETGDRCRNCGYDFSLTPGAAALMDLALDAGPEQPRPPLDLDRIIGAPESDVAADLPLFSPSQIAADHQPVVGRRTLPKHAQDEAPLISASQPPRAPLGVRRATPEVPRARSRTLTPAVAAGSLFEVPPAAVRGKGSARVIAPVETDHAPAGPASRLAAALVDVALLGAVDAGVVYFTVRLLGLTPAGVLQLPLLPLAAFFGLLNGGYFVAFTAVGGQSIGKMAVGIKVVGQEDDTVPIGRATLRTLGYLASALPLGAGFLPGMIGADRLALHDRVAHTRVVRPSSS